MKGAPMSEEEQVAPYLMALATSTGERVDEHFGRASRFDVYRVQYGYFAFVESRAVQPACQHPGHDDVRLRDAVSCLSDCAAVVCAQIGPGAQTVVEGAGISCYELAAPVRDAVKQVASYRRVEALFAEFQ